MEPRLPSRVVWNAGFPAAPDCVAMERRRLASAMPSPPTFNPREQMHLNPIQLKKLSEKIHQDAATPAGAAVLALDIEQKTGQTLSLNTVKRLVGVLPSDTTPRLSTLNIIANYLGYPDWQSLQADTEMQGSGFGENNIFKDMTTLEQGAKVEIAWLPDRRLLLRHDGNGQYEVIKSENCKLLPGDLLTLSKLAIGFPFIADKVFRDGHPLGAYHAAEGAGITLLLTP